MVDAPSDIEPPLGIEALQKLVDRISYKDNWQFVVVVFNQLEGPYLGMLTYQQNAYQPEGDRIPLRIWSQIPPMYDARQFWNWMLWRITQAEIHEVMEFFRVDNAIYNDPHAPK